MLTFGQLQEKKTKVKINPKKDDLMETPKKKHPEDCACSKCEDKEDKEGPTVESWKPEIEHIKGSDLRKKAAEKKRKEAESSLPPHLKLDAMKKAFAHTNEGVADAVLSGTYHQIKTGAKRHKDAVEKKKIKNRKAVPYAALAAEHQPEGEMVEGSAYGLYKGDGKPKGAMAAFAKRHPRDQKELDKAQEYIKKNPKFGVKEEAELEEERAARKMTLRNLQTLKKKTIPASKKAEAKRKKEGKGEYSAAYKKKETDVTNYDDKAPAKKKAATVKKATPKPKAKPAAKKTAPRKQKGAMSYDGPNKAASEAKDRVLAKAKAKKAEPKKEAPKKKASLTDKAKDFIKKGVKRHRKATQGARVFGKGVKAGAKKAVKFAKDVKKVVSEEQTFMDFIKKAQSNNINLIHNTHVEESYASQEKVSEERSEEIRTENILTFGEATRLKKEKGYDKGGSKDKALNYVKTKIRKEYGKPEGQRKKVKGAKSDAGTGKYKKRADDKKAYAAKAKKAGFKSTQDYTNTMARYGGEDNYKKGRGLGT